MKSEIGLNEAGACVDVDLSQDGVAGINEAVGRVCRDDDNAAVRYFAFFVTDCDQRGALDNKRGLDVRMRVQRWALAGLGIDNVGRDWGAVIFADEVVRHSDEGKLREIQEAHSKSLPEIRQSGERRAWLLLGKDHEQDHDHEQE
jgi:hypothetical protein